jgi:hypothetical protein
MLDLAHLWLSKVSWCWRHSSKRLGSFTPRTDTAIGLATDTDHIFCVALKAVDLVRWPNVFARDIPMWIHLLPASFASLPSP